MCFHRWMKWITIHKSEVLKNKDNKELSVGYIIYQQKICKKCNKIKLRYEQILM